MPDAKIYIRTEDLDKWNAIEKKSEFIHNALNPAHLSIQSRDGSPEVLSVIQPIKPPKDMFTKADNIEDDRHRELADDESLQFKLCKHLADPKFCKHAKNGKPCK